MSTSSSSLDHRLQNAKVPIPLTMGRHTRRPGSNTRARVCPRNRKGLVIGSAPGPGPCHPPASPRSYSHRECPIHKVKGKRCHPHLLPLSIRSQRHMPANNQATEMIARHASLFAACMSVCPFRGMSPEGDQVRSPMPHIVHLCIQSHHTHVGTTSVCIIYRTTRF
jgi:hypothetical protein